MKTKLVDILMDAGYNLIAACEIAEEVITELRAREPGKYTYTFKAARGSVSITFRKS